MIIVQRGNDFPNVLICWFLIKPIDFFKATLFEQTEEKNIDDIDNLLPDSLLGPYPILNNNL